MTDVERLLREYIKQYESGSGDPTSLLGQAEGRDRARLSALIEGWLELEAPPREWDAEAFEGSLSERAIARLAESWSGASGELPTKLADLRKAKQIHRGDLVASLAEALGVSARREKVGHYYHQLERGLLPAEGVSSRVFEALAGLLDTSAEKLRSAGAAAAPGTGAVVPAATQARLARPAPEYVDEDAISEGGPAAREEPEERDEVDRLFTEGD